MAILWPLKYGNHMTAVLYAVFMSLLKREARFPASLESSKASMPLYHQHRNNLNNFEDKVRGQNRKKRSKLSSRYLASLMINDGPQNQPATVATSRNHAAHACVMSMAIGRMASQHAWATSWPGKRSGRYFFA